MSKEDVIEVERYCFRIITLILCLKNAKLENGHEVLAHLSGENWVDTFYQEIVKLEGICTMILLKVGLNGELNKLK